MFENIGGKLKLIAKIFLIISLIYIIVSIISDISNFIDDLPYSLIVYVIETIKYIAISFGIYGFGSIVDDISEIKQAMENKDNNDF